MLVQRGFRDKIENCGIDINEFFDVMITMKGNATYDICCFGLDAKDKLTDEAYFIFYNQTESPKEAIKYIEEYNKATFHINLKMLPEYINKLVFTISIDGEGFLGEMEEHQFLLWQNGKEAFHFSMNGSNFQKERTFISIELYKKGVWRIGVIAAGYNWGLSEMLNYYGGEEETSEVSQTSQTAAPGFTQPKVPKTSGANPVVSPEKPPEHSLVVVENGVLRSYSLEIRKQWLIGRSAVDIAQDIMLNSRFASRRHGCIENRDGQWYYVDLGSLNGTYYNGEKILPDSNGNVLPIKLKNQDVLRIDSTDLEHPANSGVWMMYSTEGIGKQWETIPLEQEEICIGRDPQLCDIQIPLPYVSGLHMRIIHDNQNYYIMDCNSMAGTWLNGAAVRGAMPLREKDKIAFGDCFMVFTGDKIILNTPVSIKRKNTLAADTKEAEDNLAETRVSGNYLDGKPVLLRANIQSRKVPSNTGRGEKELIRDVRVEVQEGTLVALLGGAGAGKSTVMNCMNGMDTAGMTGTVEYNGVDLLKNFERMKYLIGSVPQSEVFHESLTVEQELSHAARHRLPGDTKKSEIKERVNNTLRQLGIESIRKNKISKCSGGERRRVNIGIELVADRQLLCLDEPDAGLDPGNKKKLFETLRKLAHEDGKSILAIIHDVSDIELFDRVIIMNKVDDVGRLAFVGTPKEAKRHFGVEIKDVYQLMAQNPEKYIYEGE